VHGSALGADDVAQVKKKFGFDSEKQFFVPEEVRSFYLKKRDEGKQEEDKWNTLFQKYAAKYPKEVSF
jgi:transketolase